MAHIARTQGQKRVSLIIQKSYTIFFLPQTHQGELQHKYDDKRGYYCKERLMIAHPCTNYLNKRRICYSSDRSFTYGLRRNKIPNCFEETTRVLNEYVFVHDK